MTSLLEKAFVEASKLSESEQDLLASRLLTELASEDDFDRRINQTKEALIDLAREALIEHRSGQTKVLDPERL
jgi:hypothetical protein